jgi:hypothetical protein
VEIELFTRSVGSILGGIRLLFVSNGSFS